MIRPLTLVCLVAAAGAGLHVYNTKHAVSLLDRELRGLARGIEEAEARTQGLQAEWAWLTEQERLRGLAQRHLALEPMQPAQFLRMTEAERRLPAVAAYSGPTALFAAREPAAPAGTDVIALLPPLAPAPAAVPAATMLARAEPEPAPPAAPAAIPAEPAAAPAVVAAAAIPLLPEARPATPAPAALAAVPAAPAPVARMVEHPPAESRIVERRPAEPRAVEPRPALADIARATQPRPAPRPVPRPAPEFAALPPPVRAAVAQVAVAAPRAPVTQVAAAPPPRMAEAAIPLGSSLGSALAGGRPLLPPPVAFSPANAASYNGSGMALR
ncbi:hypothetical protein [Siccirubricoccus sp. G192]|uniref:cell division protein FtsL n=1 Tax=Siccirubricoccus sp. G192 TaxID=2849651 RepID=UPI001C2B775E|nr:hypothetical protein [Siccirubricoccus sp. G192]MBV1797123.1 hypothetical protein [Siccirubricoccus sp. G192]